MKLQTKRVICLSVLITSILTIIGTVSYAYFSVSADVKKEQTAELTTGTMTVKFADRGDGIDETLNFGESVTKKFTITNTGTLESSIKLNFVDLINTYTKGSLTYTLLYAETEDGEYSEVVGETDMPVSDMPTKAILAKKITLPVGATYYYNLVIKLNYLDDVDQNSDFGATFSTRFGAEDASIQTAVDKIIASSNGAKTSFDTVATTDEGIFEMEDDYGTSYYYRGAVENNYVKFGQNSAGQDMYWRIIRINGDGSLRIIYDGTSAHTNGESNTDRLAITGVAWNTTNYDDAKYVGYMYGGANGVASTSKAQAQTNETSTNIKTQLDTWYKENIVDTGYSGVVADILFCNDRSTPGSSVSNWTDDTGLGYRQNKTMYGAGARFLTGNNGTSLSGRTNVKPIFTCPEKNDSFTVSDTTKGNGDLTYPVGLITADEIVTAGGKYYQSNDSANNDKYYLYKGSWYWSLSPYIYNTGATVFNVSTYVGYSGVFSPSGAVAPVINIAAEYVEKMIGEGTIESPYEIIYNN